MGLKQLMRLRVGQGDAMRDNLIAFIKAFQALAAADPSIGEHQLGLGEHHVERLVLRFGAGYYPGDAVLVQRLTLNSGSARALTVEEAVDEYLAYYRLN